MSLFTDCTECKIQFRKKSMKSRENICYRCKQWRKDFLREDAATITNKMRKALEEIKELQGLLGKINEHYIEQLILDKLEKIVDKKTEKITSLLATVNSRQSKAIEELTKRIEKIEE